MESYITEEICKLKCEKILEEEKRQNKRLDLVETKVSELNELVLAVHQLANTMQQMLKEQEAQGERLTALESRDGEMWRKVTGYITTAIIGIIIGYIFKQVGM